MGTDDFFNVLGMAFDVVSPLPQIMIALMSLLLIVKYVQQVIFESEIVPNRPTIERSNSVEPVNTIEVVKWVATPPAKNPAAGQRLCKYCGRGYENNHRGYCRGCGAPLTRG